MTQFTMKLFNNLQYFFLVFKLVRQLLSTWQTFVFFPYAKFFLSCFNISTCNKSIIDFHHVGRFRFSCFFLILVFVSSIAFCLWRIIPFIFLHSFISILVSDLRLQQFTFSFVHPASHAAFFRIFVNVYVNFLSTKVFFIVQCAANFYAKDTTLHHFSFKSKPTQQGLYNSRLELQNA